MAAQGDHNIWEMKKFIKNITNLFPFVCHVVFLMYSQQYRLRLYIRKTTQQTNGTKWVIFFKYCGLPVVAVHNFNSLEKYFWRTSKTSCLFIATSARTSSSNVRSGSQFSILLNSSLVGLLESSVGSKILHLSFGILSSFARCLQCGEGGSSFSKSVIWSSKSESSRMSFTGSSPEKCK